MDFVTLNVYCLAYTPSFWKTIYIFQHIVTASIFRVLPKHRSCTSCTYSCSGCKSCRYACQGLDKQNEHLMSVMFRCNFLIISHN